MYCIFEYDSVWHVGLLVVRGLCQTVDELVKTVMSFLIEFMTS